MIFEKFLLIIATFFVASNAQCPTYWWPLSPATPSINFFSEVMRGDNIFYFTGIPLATSIVTFTTADRTTTASGYRSFTFALAGSLQVAPDTYFCNGVFTISIWIKGTAAAATGVLLEFRDSAATATLTGNGVTVGFAADPYKPQLIVNAQPVSISTAAAGLTNNAWNFLAITYAGANLNPIFYSQTIATASITGNPGTVTIPVAPTCTTMIKNFIGTDIANTVATSLFAIQGITSLNDLKIYNSALSATQIQSRYTAEISINLKNKPLKNNN